MTKCLDFAGHKTIRRWNIAVWLSWTCSDIKTVSASVHAMIKKREIRKRHVLHTQFILDLHIKKSVRSFSARSLSIISTDISVPLHGNFELRPLGDTMGNASSVTRAWRNIWKKHHPLAGDSPWRHYRRDHNIRTAGRIHHQLFRLHWLVCLKKRAFW